MLPVKRNSDVPDLRNIALDKDGQELFFPADTPPDFGFFGLDQEVDWAYNKFQKGEYKSKLDRIRKLAQGLNRIPGILLPDFKFPIYLAIATSLFKSFQGYSGEFKTFNELDTAATEISSNIPRALLESGILEKKGKTWTNPDISARNLKKTLLKVPEYNLLPDELKDYYGVNLLLLPTTFNPLRASVKLEPLDIKKFDDRYIKFYEELVKRQIPGFFDHRGQSSLWDRWLGIYDFRALSDESLSLFPQYGVEIPKQETKAIVKRSNEPIGAFYHLYGTKNPVKELLKKSLEEKVLDETGAVDEEATKIYHKVIDNIDQGLSIHFRLMHFRMSKIKDKITPDQKRVIGMGLLDYLLTQLNVDQLGNWNDLHYVYEDIGHTAVKFNPEVAGKIRYYYENLSSDFIHYYLECTSRGMINGHVYSRESQDNIDKINSGEDVTTERHYNKHGGEENLLPYQEEWKAHLLKVTQNELKGETVTPETLDEIYQYDVLLGVLSGARYWYFEKMDDQACGNILRLLEFNMGIPLPELRGRIAQMKSKKFVEDIKPLEITAITQEKMLTGETEPADRKYEAYIILHPDLAKTHLDNEWYQYNEFCMKPDLDRHIEEGGKVYVLPYKDVNDSSEMIKSYLDTDNVTVMEPLSHEAGLVPAGIDQFKLQYTKLKIEMYEDRINKTKLVGVTHNQSEYDLGKCLGTSSFDRYPEELFRAVCSYFNIAVSFPKADGTKHFFGPEELGERLHYYDVSLAKDYDSLFLHKTETYP